MMYCPRSVPYKVEQEHSTYETWEHLDTCCFTVLLYAPYIYGVVVQITVLYFCIIPGTIIVHQAWDEPDSDFPNGRSPTTSLHRMGQEAIISFSFPIDNIFATEGLDNTTDVSLLPQLASSAVCTGFDFVRINQENGTLSVAVKECFSENAR